MSPCKNGGARSIANYFATHRTGSAHYVVDPGEIVQCVREGTIAYHAPPNTGSIGIELCDPQSGSATRWADGNHTAMLQRAAKLVVEIAKRHKVPLTRIGPSDLRAGKHGICGHVDVSYAWHQTDHGDPMEAGPFPWSRFMEMIKSAASGGEDDLPYTRDQLKDIVREVLHEDVNPRPSETEDVFDPDSNPGFKPTNKTWALVSFWKQAVQGLIVVWRQNKALKAELDQVNAKLDQLLAK